MQIWFAGRYTGDVTTLLSNAQADAVSSEFNISGYKHTTLQVAFSGNAKDILVSIYGTIDDGSTWSRVHQFTLAGYNKFIIDDSTYDQYTTADTVWEVTPRVQKIKAEVVDLGTPVGRVTLKMLGSRV